MPSFSSHLTVLAQSASLYSSAPVFQVPRVDPSTGRVLDWSSISYGRFKQDVELTARHWRSVLKGNDIQEGSIVGLWYGFHSLGGFAYLDVLHIYGLSRAGYIPQLFSIRLPNPIVVLELLNKADAKALIFDPSFQSIVTEISLPTYSVESIQNMTAQNESLPAIPAVTDGRQIAFVFHTSGSTSGSPKLVPCSYQWLDTTVLKAKIATIPLNKQQDVSVWMGSMCHIAQSFMFLGALQHGSCVIQPSKIGFSSQELIDMILSCRLNRLNQFSTFLSPHLRNSREDPKLLGYLQSLDEILFSGLPLGREDEEWAYSNGLKMKNLFGSTECGAMLLSVGGQGHDAPLLRPIPGVSYEFGPIDGPAQAESGLRSSGRLLELVIRSESGDCPTTALRSSDGHFHTGDLFQEVMPGMYVFRGRNDDWIKSENSLRCDTKAIEDNIRAVCGHLIEECIVVGSGRPSPALFVEPAVGVDGDRLKREIIRKTRPFHSRRYLHERLTSPDLIIIVPPKSLPRTATKGNVRRGAVEEMYKSELDRIYLAMRQ
ncbi:hypothetical protein BJ138DRAFT_1005482 [Hygrophoropsis aurantiaca]|uniref:Uncharacterized protein n=1 Tax=Hygrophoropsis aurantiaca TaxID=72124 RepID=A0ACB8AF69_9AGAM|nr:hypothetical protein BJ138DRAFT_1005482 [Hygrophoropsis aurantiaca]